MLNIVDTNMFGGVTIEQQITDMVKRSFEQFFNEEEYVKYLNCKLFAPAPNSSTREQFANMGCY